MDQQTGGDTLKIRQTVSASMSLLDPRSRRRFILAAISQTLLSAMDLLGIGAVGVAGTVAISVLQSNTLPPTIEQALGAVGLDGLSGTQFLILLVVVAVALFTSKSALAAWLLHKQLKFIARCSQQVSLGLANKLLKQPLVRIQRRGSAETIYALTDGVTSAVVFTLGQALVAVAELSLLVIVGVAMLAIEPFSAICALLFFVLIGFGLHKIFGIVSMRAGSAFADGKVDCHQTLNESIGAYRELSLSGNMPSLLSRFGAARWRTDDAAATLTYVTQINRYVMETAVVFGIVLIVGVQLAFKDPVSAAGSIALFLAAALRLMPSLLRLQLSLGTIKASGGQATRTYDLARDLDSAPEVDAESNTASVVEGKFYPSIQISGVSFRYDRGEDWTIKDLTIDIPAGSRIGLAGKSGAGKSTIVDLMLGVMQPDLGSINIGGLPPRSAARNFPGKISYVPQQVFLVKSSIAENVALGLAPGEYSEQGVWAALEQAQLADFVSSLPAGLATQVGENGIELSGGQRQRIGLARAFYTEPQVLVLDEATSSLDADTENAITESIASIPRNVTLIVIAHRLATMRELDRVILISDGRCEASGTFDQVRALSPDFERQTSLLGLSR